MLVSLPPAGLCTTQPHRAPPERDKPHLLSRPQLAGLQFRLPVCVGIIDHQQDPGPLNNRCGGSRRLHRPRGGLRALLHGTGEGAEEAGPWRGEGGRQGLGVPALHGRGRGRAGGAVRAVQVCHVAIGQVGHEAAVGEASPEEVHGCRWRDGWFLPTWV